jgi:predicted ATP-grasp superfamily ATP-dependent carboligase
MKKFRSFKTFNILVSGPNGDVGGSIIKILGKIRAKIRIFTTGSVQPISKINYFHSPAVKENLKYVNFIKDLIFKKKIDFFFPCINEEQFLFKSKKIGNCEIFINENKKIKFFSNKLNLQNYLKLNKLTFIRSHRATKENINRIKVPFIYKPIFGEGAKGIKIVYSNYKKNKILPNDNYLIQKYIKSKKDYTAFFLKEKNNILTISVFERRLENGRTAYANLVNWEKRKKNVLYLDYLKKIALISRLEFSNIQFKIYKNKIFIYEINTRFSGTIYLHCRIFNIPLYLISKKIFGENIIEKKVIKKLEAVRKKNWKIISYET